MTCALDVIGSGIRIPDVKWQGMIGWQNDARKRKLIGALCHVFVGMPFSDEHLVRVHTAAITNGELLWTKNFGIPEEFAAVKVLVPCDDVAGTVVTAPASSPFPPGTEVYARSNYNRTGCAREYTILLTDEMAKRPQRLSWAESAAVPM
ncbi:hypothetical protein V1507DRAFT_443448 [Lipomyces tetrasporus]